MIVAVALGLSVAASAHVPVIYFAGPEDDWCGVINATQGSDIVMLYGGQYVGPCDIEAKPSTLIGEQTTVQSFDPLDPAVFATSDADYVLRLSGESLLVLQLQFQDLPADIDAIRIDGIRTVWVRFSWFRDLAGRAVVQTGLADELQVTDSEFTSVALPVDVGCGGACPLEVLEVSENLVIGGDVGITVANGSGLVIDNVISGAATGLVAWGGGGAGSGVPLEITGNLVDAVGDAIAVTAGPLRLTANVAIGAPALSAPGVSGVEALGNTFAAASGAAVDLAGWDAASGNRLIDDAVLGSVPDLPGVPVDGTVACGDGCFVDAPGWDFFPAVDSPLRGAGISDGELGPDWCGRVRDTPPSAGAIEGYGALSFGPLGPVFKGDIDCTLPVATEPPTGTDPGTTPSTPPGDDPDGDPSPPAATAETGGGCGCAAGGSRPIALAGLAALIAARRRRR